MRVVQAGLWHGSRMEKIEDHRYKKFTLERVFEESKITKG